MSKNIFPIETLTKLPREVLCALRGEVKNDYDKGCCPCCDSEIPGCTVRGQECDVCETTLFDLIEFYQFQPPELLSVTEFFDEAFESGDINPRELCEQMLEAVNTLGFTFDYTLDCQPYALRVDPDALA